MREIQIILFVSLLGLALAFEQAHPQGCSLHLDGNSRLHVNRFVEGKGSFNNSVQFSIENGEIEAWIKPSSFYVHDVGFILQSGIISTSTYAVAYELSYQFKEGYVQADFWKFVDEVWFLNSKAVFLSTNGHWVHLSLNLARQLLHVNGSAGIAVQDIGTTQQAPRGHFSIGTNFTGFIDEVRVWKKAPARAGEHVHCFEAREEDLVLFLSFDECGGNATADLSTSLACARVGPAVHKNRNHKQDNEHHKGSWKGHGYKHGNNDHNDDHDGDRDDQDDRHKQGDDYDEDHNKQGDGDDRRDHDDDRHDDHNNGRYKNNGEKGHRSRHHRRDGKNHGSCKHPTPFVLTNSTTSNSENIWNHHKQRGSGGKHGGRGNWHGPHHHEFTTMVYGPPAPQSHLSCFLAKKMHNATAQCPYRTRKHGHHGQHDENSHRHGEHWRSGTIGVNIFFFVAAFAACFCCVRCCRLMRRRRTINNNGFVSLQPSNTPNAPVNVNDSEVYPGNYYHYPIATELDQQPMRFDGSKLYQPMWQADDATPPQMWDPRMMGGYVYYMPQAQMPPPILQDGEQQEPTN